MKTVHFLTGRTKIEDYLTTPVRYNRARLRSLGYDVRFHYRPTPAALECDILCFVSKPVITMTGETSEVFQESGPVLSLLREAGTRAGKLVWMDISDSTSVTHFELLPQVDRYLKKHLLKDRSLYGQPFYGGRIFTDYYHRVFHIEDKKPFTQFYPLDPAEEHKVSLSWNMGMGDMYDAFSRKNSLRRLLPWLIRPNYRPPYVSPRAARDQDIFLRTSADLGRDTVSFGRRELISRLSALLEKRPGLSGSVQGHLPIAQYRDNMRRARIAFGPFGWGELNVKEYEAFIFGACLVRPDISHMETWPDLSAAGETFATYAWDFSDLEEVVCGLLADEPRRLAMAEAGQQAYRDSISQAGMERFCEHFARQLTF